MKWYFIALKRSFNFSGRAGRAEYWTFQVVYSIILILLYLLINLNENKQNESTTVQVIIISFFLIHTIPNISITIRRMHDVDRSGWTLLGLTILSTVMSNFPLIVSIIPGLYTIYLLTKPGNLEENRYGPPYYGITDENDLKNNLYVDGNITLNTSHSYIPKVKKSFNKVDNEPTILPYEQELKLEESRINIQSYEKKWFVYGKTKKYGPYTLEQLIGFLENEDIKMDSICREINSKVKISIGDIYEIKNHLNKNK